MTLWLHLSQRIAELKAENFRLAAGQCVVENGLVGDEHGHFGCTLVREREQVVAWLRWQAESTAEDASIPKAVWWALNFAASTIERGDHVLAQGIEAGTGETEGLDAKHESPVTEGHAPIPSDPLSKGGVSR